MREIVATIQAEQDIVIRSTLDQALIVQGGPGTGKTAVALHRAAFLLFEHRRRLSRDGVLVDRSQLGLPRLHRQRVAVARRAQRAAVHGARAVRTEGRGHRRRRTRRARWKGAAAPSRRTAARRALVASNRPTTTSSSRSGTRKHHVRRRRDRRVAVNGDGRNAAHQRAAPAAARHCPAGRCSARTGSRRGVGEGGAAQGRARTRHGRRSDRSRSSTASSPDLGASAGRGRRPTSCSSTRPTRCSTARRSLTATSWSTKPRTIRRSRCG